METSQDDYSVNLSDVIFIKRISTNKFINIYTALWRHQLVCVKEIIDENRSVENEITILTKCIHPKIVQFLGFYHRYILFEYMENGNLRDYITKTTPPMMTMSHKINMMKDISVGLHYLHNREPCGIFHRDLKPDNILVNKYGDVKIADFDVSKLIDNDKIDTYTGHTGEIGTYMWTAPEVLKHEEYNHTSDIYSLGLLFYYIWTSLHPFDDTNMSSIQIAYAKINNTTNISGVPNILDNSSLNTIIQQCCSHVKKERPSTGVIIDFIHTHLLLHNH